MDGATDNALANACLYSSKNEEWLLASLQINLHYVQLRIVQEIFRYNIAFIIVRPS